VRYIPIDSPIPDATRKPIINEHLIYLRAVNSKSVYPRSSV
jgi:hypothetical protein